jgi:hypothetical protein
MGASGHSGHELRTWAQNSGAPATVVGKQGLSEIAAEAQPAFAQAVAVGRIHHEQSWEPRRTRRGAGHGESSLGARRKRQGRRKT